MELIPMLNQKLGNDIDGANFMTFMRGNGQECAEMASEVKNKDASIRGTVYKDIYRQLKREYGYASSYKSLKRKYLADAHEFVDCYAAPTYLQEQITDANAQQSFA